MNRTKAGVWAMWRKISLELAGNQTPVPLSSSPYPILCRYVLLLTVVAPHSDRFLNESVAKQRTNREERRVVGCSDKSRELRNLHTRRPIGAPNKRMKILLSGGGRTNP
jgi:hypothetical protein